MSDDDFMGLPPNLPESSRAKLNCEGWRGDKKPITAEEIERLREMCDKATPGPWSISWHGDLFWESREEAAPLTVVAGDFRAVVCDTCPNPHYPPNEWDEVERNACFIAASRQAIPALLDEVERLTKALDEIINVGTVDFYELHVGAADRVCHMREIALTARDALGVK